MADYYTHFSCLFDLVTPANARNAPRLYTKLWVEDADNDDPVCSGFELTLQDGNDAHILWIHDDVSGNVDQVIGFVLRLAHAFDLSGLWGFDYANTCSRPRVDAFGGGACLIDLGAGKSIGWISTQDWLAAALNREDVNA